MTLYRRAEAPTEFAATDFLQPLPSYPCPGARSLTTATHTHAHAQVKHSTSFRVGLDQFAKLFVVLDWHVVDTRRLQVGTEAFLGSAYTAPI